MSSRRRTRPTAYPLVRLRADGDGMEREALAKARGALGEGPLGIERIVQTAPDWVQYQVVLIEGRT